MAYPNHLQESFGSWKGEAKEVEGTYPCWMEGPTQPSAWTSWSTFMVGQQ